MRAGRRMAAMPGLVGGLTMSPPDNVNARCGFKSVGHLQRFASVHGVVQNLFRVGRHLLRAAHHRVLRTRAFAEWNAVTCAS